MNTASSKIRKFGLDSCDIIVILLLAVKLILTAVFFPGFEMPDEEAHFRRIQEGSSMSIYYPVMRVFYGFFTDMFYEQGNIEVEYNPDFSYASNSLRTIQSNFNAPVVIFLRLIQFLIVIFFIFCVYFLLKWLKLIDDDEKRFIFRLNLLYLAWPQISLSLTAFTSDFFIYLYEALFFVALVYYRRFFLLLLLNLFMVKFVDNCAIPMLGMTVFYALFYYFFRPERRDFTRGKKTILILVTFVLIFIYYVLIRKGVIGNLFPFLKPHIAYNYIFKYEPVKSLGTLFLSLYYLGGSMSLLAFLPEYALFIMLTGYLLKEIFIRKGTEENRFFLYVISAFLTFNIILLTIPVIDDGRYYYFLIPAIIVFSYRYMLGNNRISAYNSYIGLNIFFFASSLVKLFYAVGKAFLLN